MAFRPPIAKEIKEQVLGRIKEGVPVVEVARDAGINAKTVYNWISAQMGSKPGGTVVQNWQREKSELLEIIGQLTYKLSKLEKKYAHH
jgi:transposase-like protein